MDPDARSGRILGVGRGEAEGPDRPVPSAWVHQESSLRSLLNRHRDRAMSPFRSRCSRFVCPVIDAMSLFHLPTGMIGMNHSTDRGSFSPDDISEWFWDIVEKSERNRDRLRSILQSMSRDEVIRFDNEFQEAAAQLVDDPFFEFLDANTSEDGAKDVADFVVSQGKNFYSYVWTFPDQIPARIPPGELGTFTGVAVTVFWERFRDRIPHQDD